MRASTQGCKARSQAQTAPKAAWPNMSGQASAAREPARVPSASGKCWSICSQRCNCCFVPRRGAGTHRAHDGASGGKNSVCAGDQFALRHHRVCEQGAHGDDHEKRAAAPPAVNSVGVGHELRSGLTPTLQLVCVGEANAYEAAKRPEARRLAPAPRECKPARVRRRAATARVAASQTHQGQ